MDNELNRNTTNISDAARLAGAGLNTPGGMAKIAANRVALPHILRGAEKMARGKRLREIRKRRAEGARGKASAPPKKMTGVGFYMVVALALIKDTFDIIADISILLSILTFFTGLLISYIVWFYLFYNGVKLDSRKLATFAVSAIIEVIPLVNIIPTFTITLFVIRELENNKGLKKLAGTLK